MSLARIGSSYFALSFMVDVFLLGESYVSSSTSVNILQPQDVEINELLDIFRDAWNLHFQVLL